MTTEPFIIRKYPRTPHLEGSRLQPGDEDLSQVPFSAVRGRRLVVEEKCDGANSAVSFGKDGELLLQSRGHYLTGGYRERHYQLMKKWAAAHRNAFYGVLGSRYIMYGEWVYAKHTVYYDALPHYFLEFDILDRETGVFLDTGTRRRMLSGLPVVSVPVLGEGEFRGMEELLRMMEGLYIKVEEDGRVTDRMKYVRAAFLQCVDFSETHWIDKPIIPNRLSVPVESLFV